MNKIGISKKWRNIFSELLFVGPMALIFLIFVVVPFILGVNYSFTSWNGVSSQVDYTGIENYVKVLQDTKFLKAVWFTSRFTLLSVVLSNMIALGLALLLTQKIKGTKIFRVIFFLPNVISGLLLGFIWQFIFVKGFSALGEIFQIGFFQLPWLGTEATAFWALVIVTIWRTSGYLMIIYVATILNVPTELREAAVIDGATNAQYTRYVMFPMIKSAFTVCIFLAISWAFKMFDLNFSLTKGGPFNSTVSMALDIYNEAFKLNRYGLGSAKAIIFFVLVALISLIQVQFTKRNEVEI